MISVVLTACAPLPTEPVGETLDPRTGTTVWLLPKPVELVIERGREDRGDPFAYFAPFQTNQMGDFALYLWVSAPQNTGAPLPTPELFCDDKALELTPLENDLAGFGLSQAPYALPAPWSAQWYFSLPQADLQCLAGAQRVSLETHPQGAEPERFSAEGEALSALARFVIGLRS